MTKRSVIEIKDKKYIVVSTIKKKNDRYAYLINNDNFKDVLFVKYTKEELEVIEGKEKLNELIKEFNTNINLATC